MSERPGWIRIGVVETNARAISQINPEYWLDGKNGIRVESEPEPSVVDFDELAPRLLRFSNSKGEKIVGLVDSWGDLRRSTAVVIPNGWGQTKEALLPLARTIVATFRAAGEPICVVRFDGIRKRGESHNDPECRIPGREYLHYVFSQGVEDIEEVARYLVSSKEFSVSSIILLTFSAAAIEARKALARDELGLFTAWISVVGSPDVQSMTRAISGGVDFAVGHERRTEFGIQELLGVVVNIDEIVRDGEENKLLFIEHSRNDLASISVPITWYHGQFDAWVDLNRVTDILSHGHTQNRRLILFPTGHQLKSSQQALAFFQEIACETARVGARKTVRPRRPEAREIRLLRRAERARIPASSEDLQQFWRDYLVGRDQSYGFELLADSQAYRELMDLQIRLLMLSDGHQILDLGSGVGTLPTQLAEQLATPRLLSIVSIDYVREAFDRARSRLGRLAVVEGPLTFRMSYVAADLDLRHAGQRIPIDGERFDGIIGSLLLSYLENPILVLSEIYRLLKPGGRLVISSLRRDADISKLYVDAIAELRLKGRTVAIDNLNPSALANAARNFLNDAAKILELEEMGAFQFWEQEELATLVEEAGFTCVTVDASLGTPPQAYVVSGTKR